MLGRTSGKEPSCQCKRHGFDPWVWKIPWSRKRNPLQYPCLGDPTDREVWRATVHRVAKLSDTTEHSPDSLLLPAAFPTYLKVVKTFSYVPRLLIHKFKWKAQNMNVTGKYRSWMLLFSCLVVSGSLWPRGLQYARLPCPLSSPRACLTHVHWVRDAIQPSHPLSSPSSAFNLSQHQGLFKWLSSSHQVAKVLKIQLQHQSFQWILKSIL